jgi:hypothetical protein
MMWFQVALQIAIVILLALIALQLYGIEGNIGMVANAIYAGLSPEQRKLIAKDFQPFR